MDDQFLHEHREAPRPAFARALREQLRSHEADAAERRGLRLHPALAGAFAVAAIAVSFSFPAVRAGASNLLDLFRVQNLTAVPFDSARLERIKGLVEGGGDGPGLLGFETEVVRKPGEPRSVGSPEAAAAITGLTVRTPAELPRGLVLDRVMVSDEAEARMRADTRELSRMLELLDLRDVRVPTEWDGRSITVRMPRMVTMQYANGERRVTLQQGVSPEVDLPPGADLAQLGEVGLRVLGLSADEARRTASRIDWTNTLVVPVPLDATAFREITIHGRKGLLVETSGEGRDGRQRSGGVVMWAEGGHVYALGGNLHGGDLVVMAESVR